MDRKQFLKKIDDPSKQLIGNKVIALNPITQVQNRLCELYDLRKNEVTGNIEMCKARGDDHYEQINENTIYIGLKSEGYKITMSDLMALLNSNFVSVHNPILAYFEHLPEPKTGTIDFFANHVKSIHQEQFNIQFKKWLVRTIACALDCNKFNKQCLTLVGREQGTGKSSFCRYLVPHSLSKYYTENLTSDKDGQIALTQNFLIGLDELSILSRVELNQMKALFSRDRVSVRHPYARKQTTELRRASFTASTNEDSFLSDTTGSVRWLCFEIQAINWDYRKISIDSVWAEAYQLYKSGFNYEMTGQEIRENEERNEQFQVVNSEIEYCQKYFRPSNPTEGCFYTATEIRDQINEKTGRQFDLKNTNQIGKALIKLGFKRTSQRNDGIPRYGYYIESL
jgi:predicted P-loop ATPase